MVNSLKVLMGSKEDFWQLWWRQETQLLVPKNSFSSLFHDFQGPGSSSSQIQVLPSLHWAPSLTGLMVRGWSVSLDGWEAVTEHSSLALGSSMVPGQSLMGHLEPADGSSWTLSLSPLVSWSLHLLGSAGLDCSSVLEMAGFVHLRPFLGQSAVTSRGLMLTSTVLVPWLLLFSLTCTWDKGRTYLSI